MFNNTLGASSDVLNPHLGASWDIMQTRLENEGPPPTPVLQTAFASYAFRDIFGTGQDVVELFNTGTSAEQNFSAAELSSSAYTTFAASNTIRITTWHNQTENGTGLDLAQSTTNNMPKWEAAATDTDKYAATESPSMFTYSRMINTTSSAVTDEFDGTDKETTIIAVAKSNNYYVPSPDSLLFGLNENSGTYASARTNRTIGVLGATSGDPVGYFACDNSNSDTELSGGESLQSSYKIYIATDTGNARTFYRDGSSQQANTVDLGAQSYHNLYLASTGDGYTSNYVQSKICELHIFNRILTADEIAEANTALAALYQ
tara:strand:+ start:3221 stop:4174 length:954 start_codon:yes stop_codon:yes gene_type:complete